MSEIQDKADILCTPEEGQPDFLTVVLDNSGARPSVCLVLLAKFPNMNISALAPTALCQTTVRSACSMFSSYSGFVRAFASSLPQVIVRRAGVLFYGHAVVPFVQLRCETGYYGLY